MHLDNIEVVLVATAPAKIATFEETDFIFNRVPLNAPAVRVPAPSKEIPESLRATGVRKEPFMPFAFF